MQTSIARALPLFLLWAGTLFGQSKLKEGNIWYFGQNAGVSFERGTAVPITDGKLNAIEGCASIADSEGKLLFYTNGTTVWDKNHQVMPNGSGLDGHWSSTTCLAIPAIGQVERYYVFTVDELLGAKGLRYSVIDMSANDGLGAVLADQKNVLLANNIQEKFTAVKHRNGKDGWLIARVGTETKHEFVAFLMTKQGIQPEPVRSSLPCQPIPKNDQENNSIGQMKASPDGTMLASTRSISGYVDLFDFDNATGIVSNPISIKQRYYSDGYGVEFSPDGSRLYASATGLGEVYQYNLQTRNAEEIAKSATLVGKAPAWVGALQLAPDGKIYFPIYHTSFLGVIHQPNALGKDCNYANNFTELSGRKTTLGLPSFLPSFFEHRAKAPKIAELKLDKDTKVKLGETYVMKNVLFETAKFDLKPISFPELDKLADLLKRNPTYKIEISGHTDNVGNKSSNLVLSENRAASVRKYLISKGIQEKRIQSAGFGSQKPVADNSTEEGRAQNRRVECRFLQ